MPNVLIIDDTPEQRDAIARAARDAGFADGDLAYAAGPDEVPSFRSSSPDIAVVDLHLGDEFEEAGIGIIQQIRSEVPGCKIIAFTNSLDNSAGVRALAHGADRFISGRWRFVNWSELMKQELSIYRALLEGATFPL